MSRPLVGHVNTIITLMTRSAFWVSPQTCFVVVSSCRTGANFVFGVSVVHLSLETVADSSDPTADALKAISEPGGDHRQSTAHSCAVRCGVSASAIAQSLERDPFATRASSSRNRARWLAATGANKRSSVSMAAPRLLSSTFRPVVRQANDVGARVGFDRCASDIARRNQPLHQDGQGRAVDAGGADNVGLAGAFPTLQHGQNDVLARGEGRALIGEEVVGALTGQMQQMK